MALADQRCYLPGAILAGRGALYASQGYAGARISLPNTDELHGILVVLLPLVEQLHLQLTCAGAPLH